MRIARVFLARPLHSGMEVTLDKNAYRHTVQVLRLRTGQAITLFNGDGADYPATLSVGPRSASALITGISALSPESPLNITLVQAISRGERMDFTLQKSVELGVHCIQPVLTERTVVKLDAKRRKNRTDHWQAIIISACEQSGRNRVPTLKEPLTLTDYFNDALIESQTRLVLSPTASLSMSELSLEKGLAADLLIGPEGGLSDDEIEKAISHQFRPIRMGPRILRTETAALAAISVLQSRSGDPG